MEPVDDVLEPPSGGTEVGAVVPARSTRTETHSRAWRISLIWDLLLVLVLLSGAYFRWIGLNWDQNQHLHPDERFMTMVSTAIEPVANLGAYFDTENSTLNPHNRGYGFYVYGTLPLFLTRYVAEWQGQSGYDQVHLVGRQLSGIMDLGTILLVYLIALRLFGRRLLALLAAAFAAFSVLPIQLSHFYTVETFTNFFGFLAFYYAVRLLPRPAEQVLLPEPSELPEHTRPVTWDLSLSETSKHWGTLIPYVLFGVGLGMATASKINAAALAILLPGAVLMRWLSLPADERQRWALVYLRNLAIAGVVSLLFFRIFQPYAFSGPSFFNFSPNPKWVANISDQRAQAAGDVDFPPALQWARRPFVWFAFQNLTVWGLGLPLGLLAWASFLWMGWRMLRGDWRRHALLWGWTLLYFLWQATSWNPTMRYLMLVYPSLAIIAAWGVLALWEARGALARWLKPAAWIVGLSVLALTGAWAFAFTRIYDRPVTRVAASHWIYQNVPGPINLHIETGNGTGTTSGASTSGSTGTSAGITNQPLAFRSGYSMENAQPLLLAFQARRAGMLTGIYFEHLVSSGDGTKFLEVAVLNTPDGGSSLTAASLVDVFAAEGDSRGKGYVVPFNPPAALEPNRTYYLRLSLSNPADWLDLAGPILLQMEDAQENFQQPLPEPVSALRAGGWYQNNFKAVETGTLQEVTLNRVVDWEGWGDLKTLRLALRSADGSTTLAQAEIRDAFAAQGDPRGTAYTFRFDAPVALSKDETYAIRLEHVDGPGALAVYSSKQASETSWDDALPLGLDGYNAYDYNYGIYRSDLNLEMYWDDTVEKRERFYTTLDQADYLFISSNRQWGTTVRVPERYPLTTTYYRELLGCPPDKDILWCYSVAEPGMFSGKLGYELVSIAQSDPNLGNLRFNTQFAEEAFTVYDHPKVLIFKKTLAYTSEQVRTILGAVDLTTVVHLTPRQATRYTGNLMLPPDRLAQQRAGGTWADLFSPNAVYNQQPALAAVLWYLVIALLGWVMLPFTRLALRGLPDRGYPFARLVGMLALAYLVWLLGSFKVPFTALTITLVFVALLAANLALAYFERRVLLSELREGWKYMLAVEGIFLAFFLLFLFVRLGNPDLWHPWKGGEKPMDFSYFNAVLKSTSFPPYDPWFAGGYLNYYYYGFVIVGVPVKWLGIYPSIAYNLILPTLFALLAIGGFSLGWNLYASVNRVRVFGRSLTGKLTETLAESGPAGAYLAGIGAGLAITVLGNWGTVRMMWQGIQRLANMQVPFESANLITRLAWTLEGLVKLIGVPGTRLPYGPGDWYWTPSRVFPGEPITEFPAFTFLYADLHAHMIALPVTALVLAWALAMVLGKWGWKGWGHLGISFALGGLAIGALRATNTWDWPTYLALGCIAVVYTALRYGQICCFEIPGVRDLRIKRLIIAVFGVGLLVLLSTLLYQPFMQWYGQAYNNIDPWQGEHSPFWSYMTHWGAFLFVIVTWLFTETIDWMDSTPVSSLNKLRPWGWLIRLGGIGLLLALAALWWLKVEIGWLALPLGAWAAILLLRPGLHDAKRVVLFLVGTAMVLTLFVEVAVLRGDIGRMNTVFKFYLQAWTLLSLSAAASLFWLTPLMTRLWRPNPQMAWELALIVAVAGAAFFPIMAGLDKMNDRMAPNAPRTLDGMTYMASSTFAAEDINMDLSEDYRAIQWMQRNVSGSPVIVEANVPEYRWGTRYTVYTGLPGVVGWNWHQRQQRASNPSEWVTNRVDAVGAFYNTANLELAQNFLQRYDVQYIIVGQLERATYAAQGLDKFQQFDGDLWREVYRDGSTVIYQVNPK